MTPWRVLQGDCVERMRELPDASIDAVVTDPPAGISFMGRDWDHHMGGMDRWIEWMAGVMREALRVCKPGAHAMVWAIPRTSHWTGMALERAGWEVRDVVTHLFGSGFPKSHNLPDGRGTALKPAAEFWFLARKPLAGTVAGNVLEYGTGALNIDGTRIGTTKDVPASLRKGNEFFGLGPDSAEHSGMDPNMGRWPANVVLDEEAARMLDEQTGDLGISAGGGRGASTSWEGGPVHALDEPQGFGDSGGASRFFYCAKASSAERSAGLTNGDRSTHPTVKPIELMRWLIRLVTPPGGIVLDPFLGSGTTGAAAMREPCVGEFIGIERDEEYLPIAEARIRWWAEHPDGMKLVERLEHEQERKTIVASGQGSLFDAA